MLLKSFGGAVLGHWIDVLRNHVMWMETTYANFA